MKHDCLLFSSFLVTSCLLSYLFYTGKEVSRGLVVPRLQCLLSVPAQTVCAGAHVLLSLCHSLLHRFKCCHFKKQLLLGLLRGLHSYCHIPPLLMPFKGEAKDGIFFGFLFCTLLKQLIYHQLLILTSFREEQSAFLENQVRFWLPHPSALSAWPLIDLLYCNSFYKHKSKRQHPSLRKLDSNFQRNRIQIGKQLSLLSNGLSI